MKKDALSDDGIIDEYAKLAQTLDGLWFLKIEEKYGFKAALEVDDLVWRIYGKIEARRLKRFHENLGLLKNKDPIQVLELLLGKSLFNKTLSYDSSIDDDGKILTFHVKKCKTFDGMLKVGRNKEQIHDVCYKIGISFYEAFSREIDERFQVECTHLAIDSTGDLSNEKNLCGWRFFLQHREESM
ncbi:MAG: DUF6125 family protein [Promethearchaeota archaeon]